jgi:hypothetical protein
MSWLGNKPESNSHLGKTACSLTRGRFSRKDQGNSCESARKPQLAPASCMLGHKLGVLEGVCIDPIRGAVGVVTSRDLICSAPACGQDKPDGSTIFLRENRTQRFGERELAASFAR